MYIPIYYKINKDKKLKANDIVLYGYFDSIYLLTKKEIKLSKKELEQLFNISSKTILNSLDKLKNQELIDYHKENDFFTISVNQLKSLYFNISLDLFEHDIFKNNYSLAIFYGYLSFLCFDKGNNEIEIKNEVFINDLNLSNKTVSEFIKILINNNFIRVKVKSKKNYYTINNQLYSKLNSNSKSIIIPTIDTKIKPAQNFYLYKPNILRKFDKDGFRHFKTFKDMCKTLEIPSDNKEIAKKSIQQYYILSCNLSREWSIKLKSIDKKEKQLIEAKKHSVYIINIEGIDFKVHSAFYLKPLMHLNDSYFFPKLLNEDAYSTKNGLIINLFGKCGLFSQLLHYDSLDLEKYINCRKPTKDDIEFLFTLKEMVYSHFENIGKNKIKALKSKNIIDIKNCYTDNISNNIILNNDKILKASKKEALEELNGIFKLHITNELEIPPEYYSMYKDRYKLIFNELDSENLKRKIGNKKMWFYPLNNYFEYYDNHPLDLSEDTKKDLIILFNAIRYRLLYNLETKVNQGDKKCIKFKDKLEEIINKYCVYNTTNSEYYGLKELYSFNDYEKEQIRTNKISKLLIEYDQKSKINGIPIENYSREEINEFLKEFDSIDSNIEFYENYDLGSFNVYKIENYIDSFKKRLKMYKEINAELAEKYSNGTVHIKNIKIEENEE